MSIFNGLLIAIFLLLLAASAAVVGSMVVLAIFDLAFRREHPSTPTEATNSNSELADSYALEAASGQDDAAARFKQQQLAA